MRKWNQKTSEHKPVESTHLSPLLLLLLLLLLPPPLPLGLSDGIAGHPFQNVNQSVRFFPVFLNTFAPEGGREGGREGGKK